MRDDLLDAQSAVDWAIEQIPVLKERLMSFERRRPFEIVMELDPQKSDDVLMVAYGLGMPDLIINAEVGAIINSIRSSLDLLFTAIVGRNGVKFSRKAFPICPTAADFAGKLKRLEKEKHLSSSEASTIKALKLYRRGNQGSFMFSINSTSCVSIAA